MAYYLNYWMPRLHTLVFSLLLAMILVVGNSEAKETDENLEIKIPKGWQLISAEKLKDSEWGVEASLLKLQTEIRTYLPPQQNTDNWKEMIYIEQNRNNRSFTPMQLFSAAVATQSQNCDYGESNHQKPVKEKGNFVVQGFYLCSRNKTTGKGTLLMVKIIEARKKYYTIIRTRRGKPLPSEKIPKIMSSIPGQFKNWGKWFAAISVGNKGNPYKMEKYATGTGFLVNNRGDILTSHHVINDCRETRVPTVGKLEVLASDEKNDLALLSVHRKPKKTAFFKPAGQLRPGEQVVIVGFPLHGLLTSDLNVSTGTVSALAGPNNNRNLIQISAPVQPGNSGGPVHGPSGEVVGVVMGMLSGNQIQNVNFAVSSNTVQQFLDKHKTPYDKTRGSAAPDTFNAADIADKAKKYTLLVECWK